MPRFETRLAGLIRDADDIARLVTGKPLAELTQKAFDLWGADVAKKLHEVSPAPNSPYAVMGVRQDASTLVVKAAYRALAKTTHPDVADGNIEQWKKIKEAYEQIMNDRGLRP